jgi:programmed cell death protein 5
LDNGARERLNRIRIVKPDKAAGIEELLIKTARGGQLRGKINEAQLIDLLEQVNQQSGASSKIVARPHQSL